MHDTRYIIEGRICQAVERISARLLTFLFSTRTIPYRSTPNPMESNDIMLPSPLPSALAPLRPPRDLASQFKLTIWVPLPDYLTITDLL
jgi:hypothetical protein